MRFFRVGNTFIGSDDIVLTVENDSSGRSVDELLDVVCETFVDNVSGTFDIDELVDIWTEVVCWRSSVDDRCRSGLEGSTGCLGERIEEGNSPFLGHWPRLQVSKCHQCKT